MTVAPLYYLHEPNAEQMTQLTFEEMRDKKMSLEQTLAEMVDRKLNSDAILFVEREVNRLEMKCAQYLEFQKRQTEVVNPTVEP